MNQDVWVYLISSAIALLGVVSTVGGVYLGVYRSGLNDFNAYIKGWPVFLGIVAIVVGILCLLQGIGGPIAYATAQYGCRAFAHENSLNYRYHWYRGCRVGIQGHWVSPDLYRITLADE